MAGSLIGCWYTDTLHPDHQHAERGDSSRPAPSTSSAVWTSAEPGSALTAIQPARSR